MSYQQTLLNSLFNIKPVSCAAGINNNHKIQRGIKMKEIKAIIRPFKLLKVLEALKEIKTLPGITISEIIGFGKAEINTKDIKIIDDKILSVPRTKLEIVVDDSMVDEVLNIIQKVAHTGNPGDGKIFVSNVDEVLKIRTNERSKIAL